MIEDDRREKRMRLGDKNCELAILIKAKPRDPNAPIPQGYGQRGPGYQGQRYGQMGQQGGPSGPGYQRQPYQQGQHNYPGQQFGNHGSGGNSGFGHTGGVPQHGNFSGNNNNPMQRGYPSSKNVFLPEVIT